MEKIPVVRLDTISNTVVPVDTGNTYLDWESIENVNGKLYAASLTDPVNSRIYISGTDQDSNITFHADYNFLPDGKVILHIIENNYSHNKSVKSLYCYNVFEQNEALNKMRDILYECELYLINEGLTIDVDINGQDSYFLVRELAHSMQVEPYCYMSEDELRVNSFPRF